MQIGRVEGTTRVLGKSQGYLGLPVRDEIVLDVTTGQNVPAMVTAWLPTMQELERLVAGAPLHIRLFGSAHPPIMVEVGEAPK